MNILEKLLLEANAELSFSGLVGLVEWTLKGQDKEHVYMRMMSSLRVMGMNFPVIKLYRERLWERVASSEFNESAIDFRGILPKMVQTLSNQIIDAMLVEAIDEAKTFGEALGTVVSITHSRNESGGAKEQDPTKENDRQVSMYH